VFQFYVKKCLDVLQNIVGKMLVSAINFTIIN